MGLNAKAIQYNKWDWVLASLGLTPSTIIEDIEIIREKIKKGYKSGGESPYHKNLKDTTVQRNFTIRSADHHRSHSEDVWF